MILHKYIFYIYIIYTKYFKQKQKLNVYVLFAKMFFFSFNFKYNKILT